MSRLFHSTTLFAFTLHSPSILKLFPERFAFLESIYATTIYWVSTAQKSISLPVIKTSISSQTFHYPLLLSHSQLVILLPISSRIHEQSDEKGIIFLCSNLTIICIWKIYIFFLPPCWTGWDYATGSSTTVYWIHWHSLHTRLLLWNMCYSLSPSKIYSSLLIPITI